MQIGVISDTHMTQSDEGLRQAAADHFKEVELILHAGDLTGIAVLDAFAGKRCIAVRGNMDRGRAAETLPRKRIVTAAGARIGLIHGWGTPFGIQRRVLQEFTGVDIVVYGHTHKPDNTRRQGVLLFNPGAFSGSLLTKRNRTVGILSVGETISARHIRIG